MPRGLARFRGGLTTNIYVANEALGSPVCLIASHGQRHDIAFAHDVIDGFRRVGTRYDKRLANFVGSPLSLVWLR